MYYITYTKVFAVAFAFADTGYPYQSNFHMNSNYSYSYISKRGNIIYCNLYFK